MPAASKEEIEQLLPLQIDAQFPLSADELAWGYRMLAANALRENSLKEFLVAAVKRESVQQYRDIIAAAGFEPLFVVAALAREGACVNPPPHFALLEVGSNQSELVTFDESGPATLRVVGLGAENASAEPVMKALRSNGAVEKIFVSGKASGNLERADHAGNSGGTVAGRERAIDRHRWVARNVAARTRATADSDQS